MVIGSQEIYKRVMGIIENEAPTIKAEVFGLLGDSYQTQEFDTKFKELWEFNWKPIKQEVQADITVFIKSETTWANDEKNKGWGGNCKRQALEHFNKYIAKTAHTNINVLKGKIIADFQKLANRRDTARFPRRQDNSYQAEIKNQYIV